MLIDRTWLWLAAACYAAGFVLGTLGLWRERRHSRAFMYAVLALGLAAQTTGLYLRGLAVKGCPLGNTFELYQFTAWSAGVLYLVVGPAFRLSLLGYFTAMLTAALTLLSLAVPSWDATRRVGVFGGNAWIEFHAALALFSYGVFALLALTAALYLLRHYSLKSKRPGGSFAFLPSIAEADAIGGRLLGTGVLLLGASLAVGAVYWARATERVDHWKLAATLAVFGAYLALWIARRLGRVSGRRAALVALGLFPLALLSLKVVDGSRHPAPVPASGTVPRATTEEAAR
jgi:HemX protein